MGGDGSQDAKFGRLVNAVQWTASNGKQRRRQIIGLRVPTESEGLEVYSESPKRRLAQARHQRPLIRL